VATSSSARTQSERRSHRSSKWRLGELVHQLRAFTSRIGYNPSSKFADDLKSKPWYEVMQEAGIRIGLDHAEQVYKQPGLARKILAAPDNPAQVFPEETLVGRLQSGQFDFGFFYSTETSDLKILSISLPPEVSLSAHYNATMGRE
jgi:molybdate/tungstate transport system substrate-binding protein